MTHKFTGDRSDMAHRIKTANNSPAIQRKEIISGPKKVGPKKDPK